MKYCINCILPETRPNLEIDENNICNSCSNTKKKKVIIDWNSRKNEFEKIVKAIKKKSHIYDCLIPVSGGKDSTWQVLTALKYKLNLFVLLGEHLVEIKLVKKI